MAAPIKTIQVTGHDCSNLDRAEREKVLQMVCGDWSLGRFVQTPVGQIDRQTNPTVTIETEYIPNPV